MQNMGKTNKKGKDGTLRFQWKKVSIPEGSESKNPLGLISSPVALIQHQSVPLFPLLHLTLPLHTSFADEHRDSKTQLSQYLTFEFSISLKIEPTLIPLYQSRTVNSSIKNRALKTPQKFQILGGPLPCPYSNPLSRSIACPDKAKIIFLLSFIMSYCSCIYH
jgi:hypothetical protein